MIKTPVCHLLFFFLCFAVPRLACGSQDLALSESARRVLSIKCSENPDRRELIAAEFESIGITAPDARAYTSYLFDGYESEPAFDTQLSGNEGSIEDYIYAAIMASHDQSYDLIEHLIELGKTRDFYTQTGHLLAQQLVYIQSHRQAPLFPMDDKLRKQFYPLLTRVGSDEEIQDLVESWDELASSDPVSVQIQDALFLTIVYLNQTSDTVALEWFEDAFLPAYQWREKDVFSTMITMMALFDGKIVRSYAIDRINSIDRDSDFEKDDAFRYFYQFRNESWFVPQLEQYLLEDPGPFYTELDLLIGLAQSSTRNHEKSRLGRALNKMEERLSE